jgi:hypothetical protein
MVDDVERLLANATEYSLSGLQAGLPHYFRLAVSSFVLKILCDAKLCLFSTQKVGKVVTTLGLLHYSQMARGLTPFLDLQLRFIFIVLFACHVCLSTVVCVIPMDNHLCSDLAVKVRYLVE